MKPRIKELAEQANIHFSRVGVLDGDPNGYARMVGYSNLEKFAELIVKECAHVGFNAAYPDKGVVVLTAIKQHFGVKE